MKNFSLYRRFFSALMIGTLGFALTFCASTKELEKEEIEELLDRAAEMMPMTVNVDIERYMSSLSDNYAMLHNTAPEVFRNIRAEEERINSNYGFRIQILSTRNLREAESIEQKYRDWANENEIQPRHETYIRFRQPHYRLQLGDFRSRAEAIEFSRMVRTEFPSAWVVPDQIDPEAIERINRQSRLEGEGNGDDESVTDDQNDF